MSWRGEGGKSAEEMKMCLSAPTGFALSAAAGRISPSGHPRLGNHGLKNNSLEKYESFILRYSGVSSVAPAAWLLWVPNVPC